MACNLMYHPFYEIANPTKRKRSIGMILDPEDIIKPLAVAAEILSSAVPSKKRRTTDSTENKFVAHLDVQQFEPEEISVKVTEGNCVTVEGRHEERQDEHGSISRRFLRKYVLPKEYDISKVESKLSSDGVLSITAPKTEKSGIQYREIPVIHTGKAVQNEEKKKDE